MNGQVTELAFAAIRQEFDADDMLGIRWRTNFGIALGLSPEEAYRLALGFAGVGPYEAVLDRHIARAYHP